MSESKRTVLVAAVVAVCLLVALVLAAAAAGAAGANSRDGSALECSLHLPDGWDESTSVEATFRWWPPGTDCTYRSRTGEVRHWRTSRGRASAFAAGAVVAVALAVAVPLRERRRR